MSCHRNTRLYTISALSVDVSSLGYLLSGECVEGWLMRLMLMRSWKNDAMFDTYGVKLGEVKKIVGGVRGYLHM